MTGKTFTMLSFLTAIFMICHACDNNPPKPSAQKAAQARPESPEKSAMNRPQIRDRVWPPTADDEQITLHPNLLAKNYYVVLDCSGSMSDSECSGNLTKLQAAKKALEQFSRLVPPDANLGLLVFQGGRIRELVPLGNGNRDMFRAAAQSTRPEGGTPLFSAVRTGYMRIEKQAKSQLGYGEYVLVIVTDGEATQGQDPTKIVHWILDNSPVQIHTIGFCIGTDHSLNIPGRTVYKPADNPDQLQRGLQDVLAEAEVFDVSDFSQ
jgi:uncharacterized protein YegL